MKRKKLNLTLALPTIGLFMIGLASFFVTRLFWEDRQTRQRERWDHTHRQHEHHESLKQYREKHEEAIRKYENAED